MYSIGVSNREPPKADVLQVTPDLMVLGLMRLEQLGLLRGKWGTSEANRRARFYTLTAAGRRELTKEKQGWHGMAAIMHALLRGEA